MVQPRPEARPEEGMPKPRGRAAYPVRPGRFIRDYLEKYGEGSIAGMHSELKSEIGRMNLRRPKEKRLRAPTYESFRKYFGHFERLHLVEFVRDETPEEKQARAEKGELIANPKLLSIRMLQPWPDSQPIPPTQVVPSTRRIYRLSAVGRSEEVAFLWDDPLARSLFRQILYATMAGMVPPSAPPA